MQKKHKALTKAAAFVLVCLMFGLGVQPGSLQSGVCENALKECLNDWYNQAWGYIGTVYCAMGYAFCKKYVDPLV